MENGSEKRERGFRSQAPLLRPRPRRDTRLAAWPHLCPRVGSSESHTCLAHSSRGLGLPATYRCSRRSHFDLSGRWKKGQRFTHSGKLAGLQQLWSNGGGGGTLSLSISSLSIPISMTYRSVPYSTNIPNYMLLFHFSIHLLEQRRALGESSQAGRSYEWKGLHFKFACLYISSHHTR